MKKLSKMLSSVIAIIMILSVASVGMTAYAVSDDIIGNYDYTITSPYDNVNWSAVSAYKAATHVHTVRSDGDVELNDMIREYYRLGYDGLALTDHGTINYGWTDGGHRLTWFDYQYFVHGPVDELSQEEYTAITTGTKVPNGGTQPRGYGMTEIPLGNELNGASTNKCHINSYYADCGHGDLEMNTSWPESAVVKSYNANGFTHINHVGEWAEGNDSALVYNDSWLTRFTSIFERYCPNREGWTNGERGVIGMELVNTADSRTWNDRRYVYDEILKRLAPQGINVYGFCEDDAHEYSDCDRNAQFFLMTSNDTAAQNIKHSMFYGEFYTSSKNSRNAYELGSGFVANGPYPSVSNISKDVGKNQIKITCKDATKVRLVADGNVIDTKRISTAQQTVTFDLNAYEDKINSYVRIYLTGAGGITYLQPFLIQREANDQATVQFITPSSDTTVKVYNSAGTLITSEYANYYYILPAGEYTYTASRRGYVDKTDSFTVTQSDIANAVQKKITVTLEEDSDVTFAYFYAPETIYLSPSDNISFQYYIDRANAVGGLLNAQANKTTGNVYFHREGATNVSLSYTAEEGATSISYISINSQNAAGSTLSTQITSGALSRALINGEYVLIKWTATYTYKDITYQSYTYSYVYKTPTGSSGTLSAGGRARTEKNITTWPHSTMTLAATVYAFGLHDVVTNKTQAYKFGPYTGNTFAAGDGTQMTGTGYTWRADSSSGGSNKVNVEGEVGYIYADRSRINNFSEVPYLSLGFDLNTSVQEKDYAEEVGVKLYFGDKSDATNCLYKFDCTGNTHNAYTRYSKTAAMTATAMSHGGNHLAEHNGTQLYRSDNTVNSKKLNYPLPGGETGETLVPLVGYAKGNKSSRNNEVEATIRIGVINVNKNDLRAKLNDSIKLSYQESWFPSSTDWDTYQSSIVRAAKILGNPAADVEDVEIAEANLGTVTESTTLKTGTATVKHFWTFGGNTGLIHAEPSFTYTYNDNLAANAIIVAGYTYASRFECYANGVLIDEGTESFDNAAAAAESYEWRFYYYPNSYNVSYNTGMSQPFSPNSGSGSSASYGQNYVITGNYPSRTGYTFSGWYLDVAETAFSSGETIRWNYADNGIFTAQWTPRTYNITFDLNGGDQSSFNPPSSYLTVDYDASYTLPETVPTKTGYAFMGWKLNGGETYTAGGQFTWTTASDSTFVAQWTNAGYTVTFDPVVSGATVSPTSKQVQYDRPYGSLPTPVRTGYSAQWYSNSSYASASLVNETTTVRISADHTLFAKWTPINYSISYNLDGGSVVGINPASYTIESSAFTLKNPTKTGFAFLGWSGTGLSTLSYTATVTVPTGSYGNRTYTAHWSVNAYTIGYTLNGGTNHPSNPSTYTVQDRVEIKPATKTGYTFTGWTGDGYTNSQTIVIPAGSTGNKSYTAGWSLNTYTITYNLNDGTNHPNNPSTYTVESSAITLGQPTRSDGYTFAGWSSNYYNGTELNVVIPRGSTGNKTFTANWSANGYIITYDLAGGLVNGTNPSGYERGNSFNLINPIREGYTFRGWAKTDLSSGNTTAPTNPAGIVSTDYGHKKFTAVWSPITYTISYNLNGGRIETSATNPGTYTPDSGDITLINPVKAGYRFVGWTGTGLSITTSDVTIPSGSYGNRAYTANWERMEYNIVYEKNGGSYAEIPKYNSESATFTIGSPVRPGYNFTGWSMNYENFVWKQGFLAMDTGYSQHSTSYPNSYYSSPIVLRAGTTYSVTTAGSVSNLRLRVFSLNGTYIGNVTTTNYTPDADCIGYILAYQGHETQALRDSVKLVVSGKHQNITIKTGSTGNIRLVANWGINTYNLSYELNSGTLSEPNPSTYTTETPTFTLNNPTKTGYDFIGWSFNGVTESIVTINQGSTGDRNYTAVWNETVYNISYELGGGTVSSANPSTYTINTATFRLNNPAKTGYTFDGWSGTGISGVSSDVTVTKGSTGNRTYVATWTPNTYPITYNLDGGSVPSGANPNGYTIEDEFTLVNPTKPGAEFLGWTGTGIGAGGSSLVTVNRGSTGARTYTAVWSNTQYTITYNLDGGEVTPSDANPTTYTVESDPITLTRPTKTGYTFLGWLGSGITGAPQEYVTIPTGSTGDRSYTAVWLLILYTIGYDLNGSGAQLDQPNETTYTIETSTFTLNNPVRPGYVFTGWTGTGHSTPATTVTIERGSTGNRTYRANWSVDSYTITYELHGGEAINPTTYTFVSPDITLNNPTRTGYRFTGWSGTGISGTGISQTVVIPTGSTGDRAYEANWELEQYTIEYQLNGGTVYATNPTTYNYHTGAITLYNPVRPGYRFLGWSSDYYEGLKTQVTIPTNSTGDKVFIANWEEGNYTITYYLNGGVVNGTNPTSYTYATPTFTIINPTREGYVFNGWLERNTNVVSDEITVYQGSSSDMALEALWVESSNNAIRYNLNGGTIPYGENPRSYVTNSGTFTLINPEKPGYTFRGWRYSQVENGPQIGEISTTMVVDTTTGGDKYYTALWGDSAGNPELYKITYNLNGGTVSGTNPTSYNVNTPTFTLINPTRAGYTFDGWTGTGLSGKQMVVNILQGSTGRRFYVANWKEIEYRITYNYNGGSVDYPNPNSYTVSSQNITLNNPTKAGYTFEGWTGTGPNSTSITTPADVIIIQSGSKGDCTFTANWSAAVEYSITYNLDGGKCVDNPTGYNVASSAITLNNPVKLGYEFLGWRGTGFVGVQKDVTIPTGSTGNRSYTAQWQLKEYPITYDLAGGTATGENPTKYTVSSDGVEIFNPGRVGYTFNGWNWTQTHKNLEWRKGFINGSNGKIELVSDYPNSMYSEPIYLRAGVAYTLSGANVNSLRWRLFKASDMSYVGYQITQTYTPPKDMICYILDYTNVGDATRANIKVTATLGTNTVNASIPSGINGDMAFTANWATNAYTITYNGLEGATVAANPQSYTPESANIVVNNPSKAGYTFTGWIGTGLTSPTTNLVIPSGSSGDRVYTAQWRAISYTITYNLNEGTFGSTSVPQSYTIDDSDIVIPIPTKTGYPFVGWQGTGITGTVRNIIIPTGSTGNKEYTAVWGAPLEGTNMINFYGYDYYNILKGNNPERVSEVKPISIVGHPIGADITPPSTDVLGYKVKEWRIEAIRNGEKVALGSDFTQQDIKNSAEELYIYPVSIEYSSTTYRITIDGVVKTYTQYAVVKAVAAETKNGQPFKYWIDGNGEIVSYNRSYSFRAHSAVSISAVYGATSGVKAAIRVSKIEYNDTYDWVNVYTERSVASGYTVIRHGVEFTDNMSEGFKHSKDASGKTSTGVFTLSIPVYDHSGAYKYGDTIYARAYVQVRDSSGTNRMIYSEVRSLKYR